MRSEPTLHEERASEGANAFDRGGRSSWAPAERPRSGGPSAPSALPFSPRIPTEPARSVGLRFAFYTAAIFAFTLSLPVLVGHGDMVVFKEDGPIEWMHVALLALTGLGALNAGRSGSTLREICFLLAAVGAMALLRELDSLLDTWNPVWGWKLPVAFLAAGAVGFGWRRRHLLPRQLRLLGAYRAFPILWAGFVVTVPFAQLVGHGDLLRLVMGDDYTRDYKRVIEEVSELIGYGLLFIGSLELVWQVRLQERAGSSTLGSSASTAAATSEPLPPAPG